MNKFESASILAGISPNEEPQVSEPTNLHVITGEVVANSEDGTVLVSMDGLVFSEDDTQYIEMDTIGGLEEGDEATIILAGENGSAMTPLAIGSTGSVDRINARVIETEHLIAEKADIQDLEAATARIGDLEADHVSVSDFSAEQANIDNLQAATADIDTIRANSAKVQNLTAAQLEADHAKVGQLDVNQIAADHATIGTLDTTYMHADMANADVAWINNGTIRDGAIVSAMINDVSANKLTAGTINGSVINVTNLNADNITAGTINGQRIGTGSLSLDKLSDDVYTEAEVNTIVDGLNERIDGAIETHTGTAVPTLNNSPANSWNTTALKDEHVGDVYYVVNSQSQQNGYCYRFTKSGSTYSWQLIKDSDVTAALSRLTTAEGKITTFDSDISTLKTDTGELKTKTQSLETSLGDKVDTTTFNELSSTVDENSASITSMGTVISNNGLTSSTNITNTVNTVSQTASGNSSKITQLTTTLGTNADGTTKTGDVMHRTSAIEQDISGFKTTVSQTYATNTTVDGLATRVSTAESNITQNANNIALKVSESDVTGNYVVGKINLNSTTATIAAQHINLQGAVTISDLASDASTALADAAETATSYVTEITGEDGIMVHPSTDDDTGVRITSDVDILRDGYSVINVGTRGDTSGNTDSGVTIYDGSGDSPSNTVVTFTGKVDSAGRRRSYIDTGNQTDGSAAEVIGTVEDIDYGSYVLRKREMQLFAYAPNGTDSGSVSAWAQTSTDGTFDESGVALYGKWLNLNHESVYISVPMEQAGAMLSVGSETLTRGSGASSWSDGTVRKSGKVVTVTINGAKLASALASGSTSGSITTIPTGYRPSNLQRGTACLSTTGNYANVWFVVSTTGGVAIANRSSLQIPTTAEISMQITYVID